MLTAKEFWTKENNQEPNDDYDYLVIGASQAYGDYVKSQLEQKPIDVVKVDNTEAIKILIDIMATLGEAHNLFAKTKLSNEVYHPISIKLSKAKVALFNYYVHLKTLLPCATPVD